MDRVRGLRTREVRAGSQTLNLKVASQQSTIRWHNISSTLDDYLERQSITGLIVLKDGEVLAERYRFGRTADARFLSMSMAKSVTSLLLGIAVDQGFVDLDAPAERYAVELEGCAYGSTRVDHLLRMSSGLTFTEYYDCNGVLAGDMARMLGAMDTGQPNLISVLRSISDRHAESGTRFNYCTAETDVLGRVLTGATQRTVADLTSEWLWQSMGAESDAFWVLSHDGQERCGGNFNATLRDWARLGLLLANDGRVGNRQVISHDYLLTATSADRQPRAFQPYHATPNFGYGRQFWIFPFAERTFALLGAHGQSVFVQPASGIVMVQTAVWPSSSSMEPHRTSERAAFWEGLLQSLGGNTAAWPR
nr:serine hydrolase [Bradyrhizobium sp. 30]